MSDSLLNKSSAVVHTIAITIAFAIISGHLPLKLIPISQLQLSLTSQLTQINQASPGENP